MKHVILSCLCVFLVPSVADARLEVVPLFADHVVLQREMPVPVWGRATPGAAVVVEFAGQKKSVVTDRQGCWMVQLQPMEASFESRSMRITGDGASATIADVLVGEVWVGSGQSNMQLTMQESEDGRATLPSANHPAIRLFKRPTAVRQPEQWIPCTSDEVANFSAVAYFFGKHLHEKLDVPVGLIVRAVGGTTIQRWVCPDIEQRDEFLSAYRAEAVRRSDEFARLKREVAKYDKRNPPPPETARWMAEMSRLTFYQNPTGGLYQRMIKPLMPFAIRGVIWYQGEFNNRPGQAEDYRRWQPLLVEGWREAWGQGDFPFLFVQMQVLGNPTTPLLRESQTMTLGRCPNTAMAVICDTSVGLHPPNKKPAGDRLAMAARGMVYGENIPAGGPLLKSMEIADDKAILTFDLVGEGLVCKGKQLTGFFICGRDRIFYPAEAKIMGDYQVAVWHADIEAPAAVRYAWMNDPRDVINLQNSAGLPASPFRTDTFKETGSLGPRPVKRMTPSAKKAKLQAKGAK